MDRGEAATPLLALGSLLVAVLVVGVVMARNGDDRADVDAGAPTTEVATTLATITTLPPTTPAPPPTTAVPTTATTTTTTTTPPFEGLVDPASSGEPWGDTVQGVLTFRGNPTRTFYGQGPLPDAPEVVWRYPGSGSLCGESTVNNETRTWCGTGWTGQPAIWEQDGETWVAFGAYDKRIHVLDADTGEPVLEPFPTGDIIKGSVTIDPDGYPLLYSGSRDDFYRVLSFDQGELVELYRLSHDQPGRLWNSDWDSASLIIDDYLFEGGENSIFHIVKLNRGYDENGLVTVDPELVFITPGYDQELLDAIGDTDVSIENSVAISGDIAYFANSGGLVQGWDLSGLDEGRDPERVFRFWAGDDIDATVVIDDEGFLYAGVEYERGLQRARDVGQVIKLDPSNPDDPLVWSVDDSSRIDGGIWATPAIHRDLLIVPTDGGRLLGIDRERGEIRWTINLPGPVWMSPTIVDDVLVQGDCSGVLHGFDVSDTTVEPPEIWTVELGGCLESSPAIWDGRIVVGSRSGAVYGIG
ncbi:MAG: PQQ-binding-like beta-propeller repeat protein [Actinomycetota bacterium]